MGSYCATMFEIGRADSFGPCENCRVPSACMDCPCPVKRQVTDDLPDPLPRDEAETAHGFESDEPGCNECDGFVYEGETCPCGLVGTQKRPDHSQHGLGKFDPTCDNCQREEALSASIVAELQDEERSRIVLQPNWKSCSACGKTGNHSHSGPRRPMLLGDIVESESVISPTGRTKDTLDVVMDEVTRWRRKMLMTDYNYGNAEMRVIAKMLGLTDEQVDTLGMKILEAFPALKSFRAVYVVHGDLMFDIETEADPEHEPGNPNCLCFGKACTDG